MKERNAKRTTPQKQVRRTNSVTLGIKPDVYSKLVLISRRRYVTPTEIIRVALGEYLSKPENEKFFI